MKAFLFQLVLLFPVAVSAQSVLPPVTTITAAGITCTFSVADAQMSLAAECVSADGTINARSVQSPSVKGAIVGYGPVMCLYWTDGLAAPTVRLQCLTDDDVTAPKITLDGKLAPVTKKRQWWVFWR